MAKSVMNVLHKETKEKRLIKASRFNPDIHERIGGPEGETFQSQAAPNKTAGGVIVPKGTKQPKAVPSKPEKEEPVPEAPAEEPKAEGEGEPEAITPEARFAELKAIGWVKLSKEEKAEYQKLKKDLA